MGMIGLVAFGASLSRQSLVERYDALITSEMPEVLRQFDEAPAATSQPQPASDPPSSDPSPTATSDAADKPAAEQGLPTIQQENSVSPFGELLLRRLLQLQDANSRITFLVAVQLARQERIGQARQMMRRIAPLDSEGFAPAHAWMAVEQLRRQEVRSPDERDQLIHDLSQAIRWNGCPPALSSLYAEFLESQGKTTQALAVLEQAATQTSQANLAAKMRIAEMAMKHGQTGRFQRTADEIRQEINQRREQNVASSTDLACLAHLLLMDQQPEPAREILREALKQSPLDSQLIRLMSESFRLEYLQSASNVRGQMKVNLGLLDAALKADPTNPGVGVEIARLMNMGQQAPPELKAALEQQLAAGQSTALTHILLANNALVSNNLTAAEPHLEIALRQAPNNPTILNNLALVLARTKPNELERALQLATAACQLAPTSADFRDTLGEVRARNGDKVGAIECYEAAIGLNGDLISARQNLAKLYAELGMSEMAAVQQNEIEKRLQERNAADVPSQQ
jgi:tetratricopeptide (TPR) repeat protein